MSKTSLSIHGEQFQINNQLTYTEISGSNPNAHGLLMNARFIQGIFDDKADRARYNRFERTFDPDRNTDELIAALPLWYQYGLRAFTVGFQGGGPCYTVDNKTVDNNPFGEDGTALDPAYAERMDRLIRAADELGMIVIVSYLYPGQIHRLRNGKAIRSAVTTASNFLRDGGYTNVIIEVVNEHDVPELAKCPIVYYPDGAAMLCDLARQQSNGLPVGCSRRGGTVDREVAEASDIILLHGNRCTRQRLYNMITEARSWNLNRPIVCNEDSHAIGQMEVTFKTQTSWGYYNNMTKQEPPTDWGITQGEDRFFAHRMAEGIGIDVPSLPIEEQYYLQGLEPAMTANGQRWIRVASLYPETINYVDFYRNGKLYYTSYDEPFPVHYIVNWRQEGVTMQSPNDEWRAIIHLRNGTTIER